MTLARAVVEGRLAACAQITAIDSVYRWQGGIEGEPEFHVLFKTRSDRYDALATAVRDWHPYKTPELQAVVVARSDPDYAAWVRDNAGPTGDAG